MLMNINLLNPGSNRKTVKAASEDVAPKIAKFSIRNNLRHKIPNEELKAGFSALLGGEVSEGWLTAYKLFLTFWLAVDKFSLSKEEKILLLPIYRSVIDGIGPVLTLASAWLYPAALTTVSVSLLAYVEPVPFFVAPKIARSWGREVCADD